VPPNIPVSTHAQQVSAHTAGGVVTAAQVLLVIVPQDAVMDDKRGAAFPAVLKLAKTSLEVDGKVVNLVPGMNLTAEVKAGRWQVIEYLLAPLQACKFESIREV
jgi:hypothetical protein